MNDKRISYRIEKHTYTRLAAAAKAKGLTVSAFARMAALEKTNEVLKEVK